MLHLGRAGKAPAGVERAGVMLRTNMHYAGYLFATMKSRATPAQLDAALRERRGALEKKYGAAVPSPATLASAAAVWEAWCVKQAGTW